MGSASYFLTRGLLVIAVMVAIITAILGPDRLIFDLLLPNVRGEYLQALGVFFGRGVCMINPVRKALVPSTLSQCNKRADDSSSLLRVLVTVNKGGSVFGGRVGFGFAWECGWCPGYGHQLETNWPPHPDLLPTYPSDVYLALPSSSNWEQYAYANSSRTVKCVVFTRDPLKRYKSLFQYAWEGGEPALWDAYHAMRKLATWKERVDWSWKSFGKASMEVTHAILTNALKRKECKQLKFEDFNTDYDGSVKRWLDYWDVNESAFPKLIDIAAPSDLNRLSPEQRAAHNHASGYSLSKADLEAIKKAFEQNEDLVMTLARESRELGY